MHQICGCGKFRCCVFLLRFYNYTVTFSELLAFNYIFMDSYNMLQLE